jgi:WD40 repeat protein
MRGKWQIWVLLAGCGLAAQTPPAPGDALPARCVYRFGTTRLRHGSRILCLAYAPDGKSLAAGGGSDPVRLWDPHTGQELLRLNDPWVQALAFNTRGTRLATAGALKTVRLWDVATGKEFAKLDGHKAAVKALALSSDDSQTVLVTGDAEGTIYLWDLQARSPGARIEKAHADEITALALTPDANRLVSASTDRAIHIWDIEEDNKKLRSLDGGCGVRALVFDAKGKTFFSAGDDYLIRRWDLRSGKLLDTLQGHKGIIVSLALSQDGTTLVSGSLDGAVRLWSTATGAPQGAFERAPGASDALALDPGGKVCASAGLNNTIQLFALPTGEEIDPSHLPTAPLTSLVLAPDGKSLFAAAAGRVYHCDAQSGKPRRDWSLGMPASEVVLALSPDGKTLASGGSAIALWDTVSGQRQALLPCKDADAVLALRFSPDGTVLAVGLRSQQVELYDAAQRKLLRRLPHPAPVSALAYAWDGAALAAGGGSKITLFEPATGRLLKAFDSREGPPALQPLVAALAFAPDGKTLAAGCYDGVIRLYEARTGKEIRACEGHISVPYALAFSRDGRLLASGSFDKTVRLWETFSGTAILTLSGHIGPVLGIALAPDERTIYSASTDTTALAWDVPGFGNPALLPGLAPAEFERAWLDLASEDPTRAYGAVWRLLGDIQKAVSFANKKVYLLEPAVVRQLFKDLNSENYPVRAQAMKRLHEYGRWMEGRLRTSLQDPSSLEAKRRSEQLLKELNVPGALSLTQERLRVRRLMLILEQAADEPARQLLRNLARRAPEDALQEEAQASLERLQRR